MPLMQYHNSDQLNCSKTVIRKINLGNPTIFNKVFNIHLKIRILIKFKDIPLPRVEGFQSNETLFVTSNLI